MDRKNDHEPGLLANILAAPLVLLTSIPPAALLLGFLFFAILGFGAYYSLNSDFFGLAAPPLDEMVFSQGYQRVSAPDQRQWSISYEFERTSTFTGVVRHVSHWREEDIPFATHDILITTGEFASQSRVHVSVLFHTFTYRYFEDPAPAGTINLLHIIPANPEIYRQLLEVREWNVVTIHGREILRIERFDPSGEFLGYWQDAGCNSILVDSVTILDAGTPVP
jgi:hypothetical protein